DFERALVIVGRRVACCIAWSETGKGSDAYNGGVYFDYHCHITFPVHAARFTEIVGKISENMVTHALCVSCDLPNFPDILRIAENHPNIFASVGVHPDYEDTPEPDVEELIRLASHPRVVAIGETGLDYYRLEGDLEWQRERFR